MEKSLKGNFIIKLFVAFSLVIAMFVGVIAYNNYAFRQMESFYNYKLYYIMERTTVLLELHQEFTELRRLFRESFFNPYWLEAADYSDRIEYEELISASYERIIYLGNAYIDSVSGDPLYQFADIYIRLSTMDGILRNTESIFRIFYVNFFANQIMDVENMLSYVADAEESIRLLRVLSIQAREDTRVLLEEQTVETQRVIFILSVIIVILLIYLAFIMVKNFSAEERETTERMALMFNNTPTIITLWDSDFKILDFNDEVLRRYETTREDYEKNFLDFSPKYQPDGSLSNVKSAEYFKKALTEGEVEFDWLHQDSKGTFIPSQVYAYKTNFRGKDAVLTYTRDMREIQAAKAKEEEITKRMQMMFDSAPLFIEYWDRDYNLVDSNMATVRSFSPFGNKEEYRANWESVFPEIQPNGRNSHSYWKINLEHTFLNGYNTWEMTCLGLKGEIYVEVRAWKMKFGDEDVVITYASDVTELKNYIEANMREREKTMIAEENSLAKSRFLAKMSHEIRTPISAVLGISEIQLQKKHPISTEEAFVKIHSSANVLLGIVNDILDLSKIESGRMEIVRQKYQSASLIWDVIQLNLIYMGDKPIKFIIKVDPNLPAWLIGDELRLKQIMNNILSNALKYTEKGSVRLSVTSRQRVDTILLIVISDTGMGMSEEQVAAIFDEYSRFHEEKHRFVVGTGLGMSIASKLIDLMKGTITVNSREGIGTTVHIEIPQGTHGTEVLGTETVANLEKFKGDSSIARKQGLEAKPMEYGKVLVVDDMEVNLYVAKGLLDMYKLQTETVISGFEAINRIKEGYVYDIIFMDHMMPEMDGIEAVKHIRELGYTGIIIAFTANALVGQAEEFMKNGFDGFMSKPIQIPHLDSILMKYIHDKYNPEEEPEEQVLVEEIELEEYDLGYDPETLQMIKDEFVRTQKDVFPQITAAIDSENFKEAAHLVHTLKGIAGLLREDRIWEVAENIEMTLKNNEVPDEDYVQDLENLLTNLLKSLGEENA